jgi:acetyltransferase-like isoleucine patch superfamily enzyme
MASVNKFEKISVGSNTWLGEGSIILANVGKNCIIGAGSVVTKDLPDNVLAVGNPAQIKRQLTFNYTDMEKQTILGWENSE